MFIYIIFFILVFVISNVSKTKVSRASFLTALAFWLLMGLRDVSVGTDTIDYVTNYFSRFHGMGFNEVLQEMNDESEPLFTLFTWFISLLTTNYSIYLLFCAAFPAIALHKLLKQELEKSSDLMLSYLLIFLLGLFTFFVAGLRQTITISLGIYAYSLIKEKEPAKFLKFKIVKLGRYLLIVLIGYFFHNSILILAFVAVLLPFLQRIRIQWWYIIPISMLYFIGSFISLGNLDIITTYLFSDRYEAYFSEEYTSQMSATAFFIQLILFMTCFVVRHKLEVEDRSNILLLNLVMIGLVFQSMSSMIADMFRVSYYFSIFYVILIPRVLRIMSKGGGNLIYAVFIILGFYYRFVIAAVNLPIYHFAF